MAMTTCRECSEPVSTEAATCPSCGAGSPTSAAHGRRQALILAACALLALVAIAVVVGLVRADGSEDELDAACDRLEQSMEGVPESLWDQTTRDALRDCR